MFAVTAAARACADACSWFNSAVMAAGSFALAAIRLAELLDQRYRRSLDLVFSSACAARASNWVLIASFSFARNSRIKSSLLLMADSH